MSYASSGALEGPAGKRPAEIGEELEAGKLAGRPADSKLAETGKMPALLPPEPFDDPSRIRSRPFLPRRAELSESRHPLWQGGTAIAAESHFPIHVDFKPSAAAWAGKVDDLHENPFHITSERVRKDGSHFGRRRFPVCYDHHTQLNVDECPDHSTSATKRSKYGVGE